MATAETKHRRAIRLLLRAAAVSILVFATLPVWFPWALKPLLNHYGLTFTGYQRIGYTRFKLDHVTGNWRYSRLEATQVESVLPTAWAWGKVFVRTNRSPSLFVRDGALFIRSRSDRPPGRATGRVDSANDLLNQVVYFNALLERTLPVVVLTNCTIRFASNAVAVPFVVSRGGQLCAKVGLPNLPEQVTLVLQQEGDSALKWTVAAPENHALLQARFWRTNSDWQLNGEANWMANSAKFMARLSTNGWWPVYAELSGPKLTIPADLVRLQGYDNLAAHLEAKLAENRFSLQAGGSAQPAAKNAAKGLSSANFALTIGGDTNALSLHSFKVQLPWLNANLTSPAGMTWSGELLTNPAQLRITAHLEKLPGNVLTGQVDGVVSVMRSRSQPPVAQFSLSATNVQGWGMAAKTISAQGVFAVAQLKLENLALQLTNGSSFALSGDCNFATHSVTNVAWKASGAFLQRFLPGVSYNRLFASGQIGGPWTNLAHAGEIAVGNLHYGRVQARDAEINWRGRNLRLNSAKIVLKSGKSTLICDGALDLNSWRRHKVSATLAQLSLSRGTGRQFSLKHPCSLAFAAGKPAGGKNPWNLDIDGFEFQSPDGGIALTVDIAWPDQGNVSAGITNVAFADISDFLKPNSINLAVARLTATASWSNGPVDSKVSIAVAATNVTGRPLILRSSWSTGRRISLNQCSIELNNLSALSITGNVPVALMPGRVGKMLNWDESQEIALTGAWLNPQGEPFFIPLPNHGELGFFDPHLDFQIAGTITKPFGRLEASAAKITWLSSAKVFSEKPELSDFHLSAKIIPDRMVLHGLNAKLNGQLLAAAGEWPLPAGAWRTLWVKRKLPDWAQAHGQLRLQSAEIAMLSRYLPQWLAPEGKLSATAELKAGKQIVGSLWLTNAATRPLGKLTPVRNISAQVSLAGHRATLQKFNGKIGGEPIQADGFVTMNGLRGLGYQVHLHGTNVPVARSLELLLRGDFDLQLNGASNAPPVISGGIRLHDGLFLQHAASLVWSGPKRPHLQPPYFSVTNDVLAGWQLKLVIAGDRFLRVRTPVFSGMLSANLNLEGTLRSPVLTGDMRVDSGRLIFPFGVLHVTQGYASFSGMDPHGPDLQITAAGQNYRYDIQLEVKGPANGAQVTFSSTPPLTSEQVLLLLTAGEIPSTDYAFSNQARVGRLATFLGRDLLSRYLGSDQGEDRLIITTGEGVSEEGKLTYSVEYRLTDRWSLIGEYDEFNAFNADLKWKVLAR